MINISIKLALVNRSSLLFQASVHQLRLFNTTQTQSQFSNHPNGIKGLASDANSSRKAPSVKKLKSKKLWKTNHSAEESKMFDKLLESGDSDKCLQYHKSIYYKRLYTVQYNSLIQLLLDQDRLEEAWWYIYSQGFWDASKVNIFLNHLASTNQHYFLLPFVYMYRHFRWYDEVTQKAFIFLMMEREATFDPTNENWKDLTKALLKLQKAKFPTNIVIKFKHDIKDFLRTKGITSYDPHRGQTFRLVNDFDPSIKPVTRQQDFLRFVMKNLYIWETTFPFFNLNSLGYGRKQVMQLFNSKVETPSIVELKQLLEKNDHEEAIKKLKDLKDITKYHIFPFTKLYCNELDLMRLIELIDYVESYTPLRIKFWALSEFSFNFLKRLPEYIDKFNDEDKAKVVAIIITKYLYQETSLNSIIWNKAIKTLLPEVLELDLTASSDKVDLDDVKNALNLGLAMSIDL